MLFTTGIYEFIACTIYLFMVLRRFQHCTGHITTGSWKGRGNQYIQFVRVLYCKLPTYHSATVAPDACTNAKNGFTGGPPKVLQFVNFTSETHFMDFLDFLYMSNNFLLYFYLFILYIYLPIYLFIIFFWLLLSTFYTIFHKPI